jgi:predicted dehydrogenase
MKKIGILGLGNNYPIMLKLLNKARDIEISGIFDTYNLLLEKVASNAKLPYTSNPFGLISKSDLLIVSKTDENSYNLIIECIQNSKHVIVDQAINLTSKEIDELNKLATEASVSVVPFLPFRFSNCLINTKSYIFNPGYIQIWHNSIPEFRANATVRSDVLLNLIDIVINLVKANVKSVNANAISVVGNSPQLINARLEFDNGCTACISIDFIASHEEFILNVYRSGQIVSIDLIKNSSVVKTFNKNNILEFDSMKPILTKNENPYEEIINYVNTFETYQTRVSHLESFKNSMDILKKTEEKILANIH